MNSFFKPMRPGSALPRLDEYTGTLPFPWIWQGKLNDERAMVLTDGTVWSRMGNVFAPRKLAPFAHLLDTAMREHPRQVLDIALVGIREPDQVRRVVILDLPRAGGGFSERYSRIKVDFRLPCYEDARACWRDYFGKPGYEGVIGRKPTAPYESGDSRNMVKSKWRN